MAHSNVELVGRPFRRVRFDLELSARSPELLRQVDPHPFVPNDPATLKERRSGNRWEV